MNLNYISSVCKAKASCCLRAPPKPASGKQRFNFPGSWRASEQRVDLVCVCLPILTEDRLPVLSSALWPPPDVSPRVQSTSQSLATLEGSSASEPTLHQVQPPASGILGPPQPPRAGLACPSPVLLCGSAVPVTTALVTAELLGWCFCTILPRRRRPGRKQSQPGGPDQQVQVSRLCWLWPHMHPSVKWVLLGCPPSWNPRGCLPSWVVWLSLCQTLCRELSVSVNLE